MVKGVTKKKSKIWKIGFILENMLILNSLNAQRFALSTSQRKTTQIDLLS